MDSSDNSSEDEYNIYTNAACKLNALKCRTKTKFKDDSDDDDDDDDEDDVMCKKSGNKKNLIKNKEEIKENTNTSFSINESQNNSDITENHGINLNSNEENAVMFVKDNHDPPNKNYNTRSSRRTTRNSNKNENISESVKSTIQINDDIEDELNITYNDSLQLSQEDNNCVLIGSPPPAKNNDSDNYEVSVKVLWRSNKLERFEIRKYETFQKIFRYFANLENVSESQILITKKDKRITPFDTPISIDWSILDILDGGIVSVDIANNKHSAESNKENICKIKIQTWDKKKLFVNLKNNQPLTNLVHSCSEQLNIPKSKMKFYFDGELIDTNETPESLDLDDEACFDLKIAK